MTADLQDLLRDTLHARAASVHDPVRWDPPADDTADDVADDLVDNDVVGVRDGSAPDHRRARWFAVAASVAVLAVAGGAVALRGRPDTPPSGSGSPAPASCSAPLPRAWTKALDASDINVGGARVAIGALSPSGTAVVKWRQGGTRHIGTLSRAGVLHSALTLHNPDNPSDESWDADRTYGAVVLTTVRGGVRRDDVLTIDLATGRHQLISLARAMPAGYALDGSVVVQDGILYWQAAPSFSGEGRYLVLAHDLRTGRTHTLAKTDEETPITRDAAGVHWNGSSGRAAKGVPAAVPGITSGRTVTGDGTAYVWAGAAKGSRVLHWTDGNGDVRTWRVRTGGPDTTPLVEAVSGPYVLFSSEPTDLTRVYVLDVRTGVVADTGLPGVIVASGARGHVLMQTGNGGALMIDTAALPGLHC